MRPDAAVVVDRNIFFYFFLETSPSFGRLDSAKLREMVQPNMIIREGEGVVFA